MKSGLLCLSDIIIYSQAQVSRTKRHLIPFDKVIRTEITDAARTYILTKCIWTAGWMDRKTYTFTAQK